MIVIAWPDRGWVVMQHAESGLAAVGTDASAAGSLLVRDLQGAAERARQGIHTRVRNACIRHWEGGGSRRIDLPREMASLVYETWDEPPPRVRIGGDQVRVPLPRYVVEQEERRIRVRYDQLGVTDRLPDRITTDLSRCYALDQIRCRALAAGAGAALLPASARCDGGSSTVTLIDGQVLTAPDYLRRCAGDGLVRP